MHGKPWGEHARTIVGMEELKCMCLFEWVALRVPMEGSGRVGMGRWQGLLSEMSAGSGGG